MVKLLLLLFSFSFSTYLLAQKPCSSPEYRQFDFWLGEWEVFAKNGKKAGDSRITLILDSCIILEEWTSASIINGLRYAGKSFNTWNALSGQWQQTWVDNTGSSTEYLKGKFSDRKLEFLTGEFQFKPDTMAIRRLTFYNLSPDKVRQHGEISKDKGRGWVTEYDLEYRRKK